MQNTGNKAVAVQPFGNPGAKIVDLTLPASWKYVRQHGKGRNLR